ncbi:MAG: DUF1834 family protein [Nitrospiraceae bacterium]|nr:DUF1834 family protein [Nitrospiraceae bacterium]
MLAEIEQAIISRITNKNLGLVTARVQTEKGPVARYPALYVAIGSEKMRRTGNNLKCEPVISVILFFKNLQREEQRRAGIYPILEGIRQALFNQSLGMRIDALLPEIWRDITTDDEREEGFLIFGMEVKTGYVVHTVDDSDVAAGNDLITIGLKYYLEPDINSDGAADAEDDVTTTQ